MTVDGTGGEDAAVACDDLGRGPHHQVGMHARHDVGVARLADGGDAAVANSDVGLDDSPVVDDHRAGDDGVGRTVGSGRPGLAHRLTEYLSATEDGLVTRPARTTAAVLGDLDEQIGVGQPDPVAGRGTEERSVAAARKLSHESNLPGGFSESP